ncbi:hypothetical protein NLJ89_g8553 [Agrocybe chaxingu]|uniref:Uncharacterized protein n=1 Tax=Agrocybe chaxingu TaxID=84603 RepID=A0A9W8JV17_9AGAR|nr:hypothetical protein NLJ89_g8553 [Agrocybe chaxingu]
MSTTVGTDEDLDDYPIMGMMQELTEGGGILLKNSLFTTASMAVLRDLFETRRRIALDPLTRIRIRSESIIDLRLMLQRRSIINARGASRLIIGLCNLIKNTHVSDTASLEQLFQTVPIVDIRDLIFSLLPVLPSDTLVVLLDGVQADIVSGNMLAKFSSLIVVAALGNIRGTSDRLIKFAKDFWPQVEEIGKQPLCSLSYPLSQVIQAWSASSELSFIVKKRARRVIEVRGLPHEFASI